MAQLLHDVGARRGRMLQGAHCATEFSLREARAIVQDLFQPRAVIYWTDFLLSMGVGSVSFLLIRRVALPWPVVGLLFVVSVLALYRAALFIHELSHLRSNQLRGFRGAWNALFGIPFMMPAFLYYTHTAHHVRKHYATAGDGEYLPLATGPARNILWYLSQSFIIPVLAIVRFLILTPVSWVSPSARRWIQQHASSMVIDPTYVRPLPSRNELRWWRVEEAGCFLYIAAGTAVIASGTLPWTLVPHLYLTAVAVIMLNAVRTLAAHRYLHRGEEVTFIQQMLDSLNYPNHPIASGLWAPVGLRFHALHHVFPSLPYHSLAEAHRRLMAQLPSDSPYRQTNSPGLWHALTTLWRNARNSQAA